MTMLGMEMGSGAVVEAKLTNSDAEANIGYWK